MFRCFIFFICFIQYSYSFSASRDSSYLHNSYQTLVFKFNPSFKDSKLLGLSIKTELSGKAGNLYYKASFCNESGETFFIEGHAFSKIGMLKSATNIFLNGKLLMSKFPSSYFGDDEVYQDIRIDAGKCYSKIYNITKDYGLYNVKGNYMALYTYHFLMSPLPNVRHWNKDRYFGRSSVSKLTVN